MTNPMKSRVTIALSVALLSFSAACSSESPGAPLPVPPSNDTGGTSAEPSPNPDPFNGLQACPVLDKALEGEGFPPSEKDTAGGDNGCDTQKIKFGSFSLDLHDDLGIGDLNADKSKQYPGDVNGRPAILVKEGVGAKGGCNVSMEVTKSSRAFLVFVLQTGTTEDACAFVEKIAEKLEPQLPKSN